MNLETLIKQHPYLKYLKGKLNHWATELDNFYGPVSNVQMDNGSVSISNSWVKRELNILIRRTSGPSTITIRTTSILPRFSEISSNTTTRTISTNETVDGSSEAIASTSSPQLTSPTPRVKRATLRL